MYFPSDMTFQYFFFDTYPGYFLQVLPIALLVGLGYWFVRWKNDKSAPAGRKVWSVLFITYIIGLICLTCFKDLIGEGWYRLLYGVPSGRVIRFYKYRLDMNLTPDFFTHMDGEMIANIVLYLPFGVLFPLYRQKTTWMMTMLAGFICSVVIEIVQPYFGRALDINDILLNGLGVAISAGVFFAVGMKTRKRKS